MSDSCSSFNMKFSYSWLKEYLPKLPLPEKTAELLHFHAFEVIDLFRDRGEWILDVDILPNRMADASSHVGLAKECGAILQMKGKGGRFKIREQKYAVKEIGRRAVDSVRIRIDVPRACMRYSARIIEDVSVKQSPAWLKKRLASVGVGSINNIVDATNYVMLEYGQPLHAFDLDKIGNSPSMSSGSRAAPREEQGIGKRTKEVVVRFAKKEEKIITLDGNEVDLDPDVLVIADVQKPLAIAGIKGGAKAAISSDTKNILIESATFDAKTIYRASRLLGIRSDASVRFSAGRVVEQTMPALNRAAALIFEIAGGRALWGAADVGGKRTSRRAIPLNLSYAQKLLGMAIPANRAKSVLQAIGCSVTQGKQIMRVVPPPERIDLELEEDLIEELGRLLGYGAIQRHAPRFSASRVSRPLVQERQTMVEDVLISFGFTEAQNYVFSSAHDLETFGLSPAEHVEILNPPSAVFQYLQSSILPGLILSQDRSRAFEFAPVFSWDKGKVRERLALGLLVKAQQETSGEKNIHRRAPSLFEAKGIMQELLRALGLADVWWKPHTHAPLFLHTGQTAAIMVGEEMVGYIGTLAPRFSKEFAKDLALAELDFERLTELASQEHEYRAPSPYPEALRDIAVLVPQDVLSDEVEQVISQAGGQLVRDVELFDYFEGEDLPDDKKSLAFHVLYQAFDRTLTDKEVGATHQKIEAALRQRGWEVR